MGSFTYCILQPWGSASAESPAAPVPLCGCSGGNAPLQHRLRAEGRESSSAQMARGGEAEIWHFRHCHLLCSDSGARATVLCQCPKPDLRKGAVKYTTNPKPLPSLHAHNPQQQDRGLEDSESRFLPPRSRHGQSFLVYS